MTIRTLVLATLVLALHAQEWLAICSRCASPTVFNKTGTGTANSVAEARMTPAAFRSECTEQGFSGAALAKCIKEQQAADGGKIYRASANCLTGTLSPIDGNQYTFAGVWSNDDIGGGRTKWRNAATGQIVGRDNASDGLGLSQQWEVLCPGPLKITRQPATTPRPAGRVQQAPSPPICNGAPGCTEVHSFAATIADFRTSTQNGYRMVTANVRFQNKLARPLILGYLSGSGVAIDDRGNRLGMNENTGLRGIGFIRGNQVDPKFVLAAGQSADARVEYAWYPRGGEIFGTMYDLEFSVREIVPVSATQFQIGLEHPLKWSGLGQPEISAAPAAVPVPASVPGPAGPATTVVAEVDHCQGISRCYSAAIFTAQVQQVTASQVSGYHVLTFRVRFRNVATQPLVLAYKSGTSVAIDNLGQRYGGRGGNIVRGMGVSARGSANAEFILQPGQTRDASFEVQRYYVRTQIGTGFTWDAAVEQLEILPLNQLRTVREFSLNFPDLTAANPLGTTTAAPASATEVRDAAKKLGDIFRRRK